MWVWLRKLMTCGKNWGWPTRMCTTCSQHWDYTRRKSQFKTQVNSSCIFSILIVLVAEALFVLGEQFYYCLCFILACLPGTCYILMLIVEAAKSCRFLLFRSTPSALKDAFPCSCRRTVWAGPLLLYYILSILSSSSPQWTSAQPSCPEVESRDGMWKHHRNAAARNSISARPNPGEGASPQLSRFSLFRAEIFLNWIWKEAQDTATLVSFKDALCYYILLARSEKQWHRVTSMILYSFTRSIYEAINTLNTSTFLKSAHFMRLRSQKEKKKNSVSVRLIFVPSY